MQQRVNRFRAARHAAAVASCGRAASFTLRQRGMGAAAKRHPRCGSAAWVLRQSVIRVAEAPAERFSPGRFFRGRPAGISEIFASILAGIAFSAEIEEAASLIFGEFPDLGRF